MTIEDVFKRIEEKRDLDRIAERLLEDKGNILTKSELGKREINRLALLYAISKKYNFDFVKELIETILLMRISLNRKGRKEVVEIFKKVLEHEGDEIKKEISE